MSNDIFKIKLEVRDSELDMQGIVNNANYYIYFEHARHKWLIARGIKFADWSKQGLQLVALSAQIEFKKPLVSCDEFYVTCVVGEPEGRVKFSLLQEIRLDKTDDIIAKAKIIGTCVNENAASRSERLFIPSELKPGFVLAAPSSSP